jgi:hypothetical protein
MRPPVIAWIAGISVVFLILAYVTFRAMGFGG